MTPAQLGKEGENRVKCSVLISEKTVEVIDRLLQGVAASLEIKSHLPVMHGVRGAQGRMLELQETGSIFQKSVKGTGEASSSLAEPGELLSCENVECQERVRARLHFARFASIHFLPAGGRKSSKELGNRFGKVSGSWDLSRESPTVGTF